LVWDVDVANQQWEIEKLRKKRKNKQIGTQNLAEFSSLSIFHERHSKGHQKQGEQQRTANDRKLTTEHKLTPVGFSDSPLASEQVLWLCVLDHAISVTGLAHHVPGSLDLPGELQHSCLPLKTSKNLGVRDPIRSKKRSNKQPKKTKNKPCHRAN